MPIPIALPEPSRSYPQDEEWCLARIDGEWRELRFHDYSDIYEVKGLYERLFYDVLKCDSPATVRGLLEAELTEAGVPPSELRVLDLGAGNGIVGAEMADLGVERVVGVDIIEEAALAAERDRPDVYDDYRVCDLTDLPDADREHLAEQEFNCLTCVAALGFGDIPPQAFLEAYNLVERGGWLAFTLKEDFLNGSDSSGFSRLIARGLDEGLLDVRVQERYRHRISTTGDPLHYVALVGTKGEDMPADLLEAGTIASSAG
jgi:SAM-dependent methyltransferase